ncbi:MAG TPA: S9 family peptidase [Thermomicrobiales bacterium]|nr:S9 family peptidase [Thermomicrobiales bacterium]
MPNASGKRPITADDLKRIKLVSDPQAQPNGSLVAWTVTTIDDEGDTYAGAIWIGNEDGSNARQLTAGTSKDSSPRWSPDGTTIAFVSNREPMLALPKKHDGENKDDKRKKADRKEQASGSNKPQIWTIKIDGGEARQASNHPNGAGSISWSPDGREIAFVASDDVTGEDGFEAPTTKGDVADERIIRDLSYRFDGQGWRERYSHIWKVDLASGEATQLTHGDVFDRDPQWSPAGNSIAFVGNRRDDRKTLMATTILSVPATGGEVTALAPDDASFADPSWAPDGSRLAFVGNLGAKAGPVNKRLWTVSAGGGDATSHTDAWDTSVGDFGMSDVHAGSDSRPVWLDDTTVTFLASQRGETQIFQLDLATDEVQALTTGKRRISGFTATAKALVYVSGTIHEPFDLFRSDRDGSNEERTSDVNRELLDEIVLSEAIDLDVTAPDGWGIQGWLLPPVNRPDDGSAKSPAIVQIHGGPHGMYGYAMFHEMQLMAARGYAVIFCNPRGSAGYGENFTTCTRARWGESDMPDVIATLETAIREHDWIDADRVGVTGGSYGGYLTNWIVSHDDRFKAAVTQRCVSNFYSFFGTSDIGFNFGEHEFGGVPWADAELLLKYSPISYVDKITTPLLIIHSEQDLRCPIEQAEQMFVALKYLGREVLFVRVPDESHDLSRSGTPSRRLARLHHLVGWFDAHM